MLVKSERNKLDIYVILLSCKFNIKNKQRFLQKNLNLIFHVSLWIFDLKKKLNFSRKKEKEIEERKGKNSLDFEREKSNCLPKKS